MSPEPEPRAEAGELAAGTVDSFLIWHLTGGRRFVTDATNASRTLLMDLQTLHWADDLCELFGVPPQILPEIRPSSGEFGTNQRPGLPAGRPPDHGGRRRPAGVADRPGLRGCPARRSVPTAPARSCWPTRATGSCPRDGA